MIVPATFRRGLGVMWKINSSGEAVDCDLWSNLFEAVCWGAQEGTVSSGLPVLGKGASTASIIDYSNPSTLAAGIQENPQAAIQGAITEQTLANQAANLLAVQNLPNPPAGTCSSSLVPNVCDWIVYATLAVVAGLLVFGMVRR